MKRNTASIFAGVLAAAVCLGFPAGAFAADGALYQLGIQSETGGPGAGNMKMPEAVPVAAAAAEKDTTGISLDPVISSTLKLSQYCLDEGIINGAHYDGIRWEYRNVLKVMAGHQGRLLSLDSKSAEYRAELSAIGADIKKAIANFTGIKRDLTLKIVRYKLTRVEKGLDDDIEFLEAARKRIAGI